jgi:hypothetical protein
VITAVVASDANSPLKSHTVTFTSDYPVKPGEVPPFSFTKTQYPDARIRTIRMLSRKNPIHPGFKKEAVELIGTFTYAPNTDPDDSTAYPHLAFLKGTSEVWEYYKNSSGAGERRSIQKSNVDLRIALTAEGWCGTVRDLILDREDLRITYKDGPPKTFDVIYLGHRFGAGIEETKVLYASTDLYGNLFSFYFPDTGMDSYFNIKYDYSIPRNSKNYSFIPSQNLISQDFSLMEVMQWLPQPAHQRKSANGMFLAIDHWVIQEQVYKNYQFDTNGNQTSLTYGDNILQKTTWHVQP